MENYGMREAHRIIVRRADSTILIFEIYILHLASHEVWCARFRLLRVRSPLLTESHWFLFLLVLRCFSSQGLLFHSMYSNGINRSYRAKNNNSSVLRKLKIKNQRLKLWNPASQDTTIFHFEICILHLVRITLCVIRTTGLPHSEIPGSKLGWQLPEAYRSLLRPSSLASVKASTPCVK